MKYLFSVFCLLLIFASCTPQAQMNVQKYAYDASVTAGIGYVKTQIPDTKVELKRIGNTNFFEAKGKYNFYQVVLLNDSTVLLSRVTDWLAIADMLTKAGHQFIESGKLVIGSKNDKSEADKPIKIETKDK